MSLVSDYIAKSQSSTLSHHTERKFSMPRPNHITLRLGDLLTTVGQQVGTRLKMALLTSRKFTRQSNEDFIEELTSSTSQRQPYNANLLLVYSQANGYGAVQQEIMTPCRINAGAVRNGGLTDMHNYRLMFAKDGGVYYAFAGVNNLSDLAVNFDMSAMPTHHVVRQALDRLSHNRASSTVLNSTQR